MPGVVSEYTKSIDRIERTAADHDERWDVRQAFNENLLLARQNIIPEATYAEQVRYAVNMTQAEIRDSYEIRQNSMRQSQGYHAG